MVTANKGSRTSPILAGMQPDPDLVEQYRQALAKRTGDVHGYAMGFAVASVREIAADHDRHCAGCSTCYLLKGLLAFLLAYELNEAPPDLLRRIHGVDPQA